MKKTIIPFAITVLSVYSCTPDNFILQNPTIQIEQGKFSGNNTNSTPDVPEKIDENLLNTGAKIHIDITKQNQVTAYFEFPEPNCSEIVSWWYRWEYIPVKSGGVKSSYDKTLIFDAANESTLLLYVQCTKPNGVKSNMILSGAKVVFKTKVKSKKVLEISPDKMFSEN